MGSLAHKVVVLALIAVLAGGKEGRSQEAVQTVEWFKQHQVERKTQLAKCNSNPGELASTPNCVNASRADSSSVWSKRGGIKAPAPLTFNLETAVERLLTSRKPHGYGPLLLRSSSPSG